MFKVPLGDAQFKQVRQEGPDVVSAGKSSPTLSPLRSEQAGLGFVIIEPDKKIHWLNQEALHILEKGHEPITGPHFLRTLSKAMQHVLTMQSNGNGNGSQPTQSVIFKSGRRYYSVWTIPLLKHHGQGVYGVTTAKKSLLVLARMPMEEPNLPLLNRKFGFTQRESNIIRLLFRGRSDKLIGQALNISTETVREHMRNIRAKLGAVSRLEVVSFLLEK